MPFRARITLVLLSCFLAGCSSGNSNRAGEVQDFLRWYNELDQTLSTIASEAEWKAATDVKDQTTGELVGAGKALAAFRGSRYVIETSRRLLTLKPSLSDLEFRQLDKILLNAAESPATIPNAASARIEVEGRLRATLDGFTFCLETSGSRCGKPVTANRIDDVLESSRDLRERLSFWEASKQVGPALKNDLEQARMLRNRMATELGYSSYFHLQVADYGMSVAEMMQTMERTLADTEPLYRQLHLYARRQLARRYKQPIPDQIPAHWLSNRWGQAWPGVAGETNLDDLFRDRKPEWIVEQAERFCTSMGWPALPKSYWEKSDLYQLPPDARRIKNPHSSTWHIDLDQDVRSSMNIVPNFRWFETAHQELGHAYYDLAYSNPGVPVVLRGGANRAFHEAVGYLVGAAARQEPYLRQIGLLPPERKIDRTDWLLNEALDGGIVFLPWSAGTMTHFEYDLYEKKLGAHEFNTRWWELTERYQGIRPPTPRGEQYCDACTKTQIVDDPAQYYDYALACLIRFQLHDYIARHILHQDPHNCNYYGNREVGQWLWEILKVGATRDWRQVIREKTGEEISSRAMVEYFKPLRQYLDKENAATR